MKSKETKNALSKKTSNKVIEEITWREESLAFSFQEYIERTCDVLLMVESEESCSDIIFSCYMGYKLKPIAPVKIITYTDLKMEIIEYANSNDPDKCGLFQEACAEAVEELEKRDTVPAELLAHLLKIKIIHTINEDIRMEQEQLFIQIAKEGEYKKMFESADAAGDGKKKKGKEKPAKGAKKSDTGKKKKGAPSENTSGITTSPAKAYSQFSKSTDHPELQVADKHLYIILTGFYNSELIGELVKIGVPLCCLLEVSFTQSALFKEDFFETITSESSSNYLEDIESVASEEEENPMVPPSSAATLHSETKICEPSLKFFWSQVIDLLHSEQQHKYMENIVHMFYKLTEYVPPQVDGEIEELCNDIFEKQFEDLSNFVMEIETLKRQYVNYTRSLKLQTIPCAPVVLPPQCLRIYNKLMNKFPPDCFSIALLMACLIEEVCSKVPEGPSESDVSLYQKESEENPLRLGDSESKPTIQHHGGIKDQVVNVLEGYMNRHDPVQGNKHNKPPFRCYTCKYDPKIDLRIDSKCFMVHASNDLQIVMNCYKRLSKELYAINMSGLKKSKAAVLRSRHACGIVLEKLMNEYNLQSWRKALGLSKDELCDAIHTFLLTQKQDTAEDPSSKTEINETQQYPCVNSHMLSCRYKIEVESVPNTFDEPDNVLAGQLSFGGLYRNFSKNVSQILSPGSLSEYCYKEYLPGPVLLQELLKAGLEYECVDQLYSPLTDTLLLLFHNDLDEFGCASIFKKEFLRTPVCTRDFCEHILLEEREWIEDQEFFYQTEYRKEVVELKRRKEELRKALYSEFIPDEFYFILPDSIKAKLLVKDEPKPAQKDSGKKKGGKPEKQDKKKKGSDSDKKKDASSKATSSKKSEAQLDIEEVLRKMPEVPEKRRLSLRCAEENEPYTFMAYDLGSSQVQMNVWTSVFHSLDGLKVVVDRTCWLGATATVTVKLVSNNHNFIFHYRPDLVTTEPIMFHAILSDGACLAFSKPIKLQKIEEAICERICKSKANKPKIAEENSAYQPKPQEIYFVSEKQDCVVRSFRIPFSRERNLVLSENLLVPFLDSLEKFNIRARVTVPAETLRHRQERRHNLRNRISTSATATKTSLSQYATVNKRKKSATRVGMVEKYSPKIIVRKVSRASMTQAGDDEFLQHSHDVQKISTIPSATEIKTRKEALQKLKEAIENHVPLFKICSSRLHKYTYVKRIKSYINIPVGSVIKRILYKPAYYKTKRTIEIKKCLPLGCVNLAKIKKPAYNIRLSLPSGLVIRDIPGVASEFPCIRQYYIDKGPQCKDIVHEESRTFLRNGNIAIKRCDGNINVLSANGRIFHFEVPYVMKTRTEKTNYRDSNPRKLQRSSNIPVHVAKRSLTTFQKLLHRVLPRRFKHLIDSKESRYYLSRRAYLKTQKKNCTNVDMLYLLESQRLPFPEYTVITPDGKKIKISKSKVYEKHKFYVATDIDFRSEETLFEREDGTCCILNRDGVLTTQFPDGTRLTTWFVESPNQVFADEIEDLHTKDAFMQTDLLSNLEQSRIQMMDFDFGLDEGWVSVFMYYEYSHPNYATVVFGGEDSEMSVILPNGSRITSKEGQKTTVTVGKFLETEFDKRKFYLKTRGCENCANSARAVLDLGSWYRGKLPKNKTDTFVHVKDSFEKVFRVNYDGKCSRNPTENTKAETDCNRHSVPTLEKLFSVKSDFSGCVYWNKPDFKTLMDFAVANENFTVDTYNNGPDENAVVEFKEYICKPYHERYICKYDEPTLKLTKYKTKQGKVPANPAYILRKVLRKIVNIDKIEPLYKCILDNCEKYGLRKRYENFELFFKHATQQLPEIQKGLKMEEDACLDPCPCVTTTKKEKLKDQESEEMQRVQILHDKWYKWQEECKKYKQLVKEDYVPLYFKSKFGSEFTDENRKDDGDYVRPSRKSEEPEDNYEDEEIEMDIGGQSSFDVIRAKSKEIDVEKQKSVEQKTGKRVIKEHLHIKIPRDMVLLYNQGRGDKSLDITENVITTRSESKGQESEDRPEKMLVLAGVRDASKVEIANRFLEMHGGAAKKYEEGSRVVLIAEETKQAPTDQPQESNSSKDVVQSVSSIHASKEETRETASRDLEVNASCKSDSIAVNITDSIEGERKSLNVIEFVDEDEQPPQMTVYVAEESESLHDEEATPQSEFLPALIDDATKADITAHRSATDVLKDVVMMSRDLLEVTSPEESVSLDDPDDAYPAYTKKRVMSVLSTLMKMVITALSECPDEIPEKVSKSITASAYRLISTANMNRSEMKLFLKTLDDLVEDAFAHVESRGNVSSSESSDIELVNKSKLIPVKNIGDVLSSYNKTKSGLKYSGSTNVKAHSRSFVNTVAQRPSKAVGGFDEGDVDSDITVSYKDLDISDSLFGFTSKFNFQRYSTCSEKESGTITKDRDRVLYTESSADFVYQPKNRKSSVNTSRVKFQKDGSNTHKSSLQIIHQSGLSQVPSATDRMEMTNFHKKHTTASMLPLLSSSINLRQLDSFFESAANFFEMTGDVSSKPTIPEGRVVVSEGTQTYKGKDVNIQTSDELLTEGRRAK